MPTDILLALEIRRRADCEVRPLAAIAAALLPALAGIVVLVLCLEYPSIQAAVILSGLE